MPLLYVPDKKAGLLLALEHGLSDSVKAQRVQMTSKLGFEEADGMPGVARIVPPSDKDMLLLIDTSGSMTGRRIQGTALTLQPDGTHSPPLASPPLTTRYMLTWQARRTTRSRFTTISPRATT